MENIIPHPQKSSFRPRSQGRMASILTLYPPLNSFKWGFRKENKKWKKVFIE